MEALRKFPIALVLAAGALAFPACKDDDGSTPGANTPTRPARGEVIGNEDAIRGIAEARCAREARCGKVGDGGSYATNDVCVQEVSSRLRSSGLNAGDCTSGVSRQDLNECVNEVQNHECNDPIGAIDALGSCLPADLCRD